MESYEKFNYALRPNKRTQGKMIFETLQRYMAVFPRRDFKYVGFGSMWFADFLYAHRKLGVKDLTSIEKAEGFKRATFNKPFKCIAMKKGDSSDVLPTLDWRKPAIVWLDYDYKPDSASLQDISQLAGDLTSSSVLLITYDARPPWPDGASANARRKILKTIFGDAAPLETNQRLLRLTHDSKYPSTLTGMLWTYIEDCLVRNGRSENHLAWQPLFSFFYADKAPMITLAAALLTDNDAGALNSMSFSTQLPFLKGKSLYSISVPPLTHKEHALLDRMLPGKIGRLPFSLSREVLESYAALYRYYPLFAEVEL